MTKIGVKVSRPCRSSRCASFHD